MTNKRKYLKNILTTMSLASVIVGSASSALGLVVDTGGAETLSAVGTWGGGAAPGNNDTINVVHNGDTIDFDREGAIIAAIRASANLGLITINASGSIGSIAGANNAAGIVFNLDNKIITLTGTAGDTGNPGVNNYNKLADIDYNNKTSTITVKSANDGQITLTKEFKNAANATLNVETNLVATSGTAAETALSVKYVNIGTNAQEATLTVRPDAGNAVTVRSVVDFKHANSKLVLDSTNGGGATTFTLNTGTIQGADDRGIVQLHAENEVLTVANKAAEKLGDNNTARLKEILITGDNAVTINLPAFAKKITLSGTGANANGFVTFTKAVDMGADSSAQFTTNTPTLQFNEDATIQTIDFANHSGIVKVATGKKLTADLVGNNAVANDIKGTLTFDGDGELVGTATRLAKLNVGKGIVKLSGEHTITEIQALGINATELADGFSLTGAINSTAGGKAGVIQFKGAGIVTGTVGNGADVGAIEIHGAGNKIVDLQSDVKAASIDFKTAGGIAKLGGNYTGNVIFTADGNLVVYGDAANHTITGNITGANRGEISANIIDGKTLEIVGNICAAGPANALKLIKATTGGNLKLSGGNVYVQNIDMRGNGGSRTLELSKNGGIYVFALQHDNNQGTVKISQDVTLGDANGSVVFSTDANNPFKKMHFEGDKTVTFAKGANIYAGSIETAIGNDGKFIFNNGASIIDAQIGTTANKFNSLTLSTANTSLELKKDAYFNGAITLDNDTTLKFGGENLVAEQIIGKGAGNGIFELNNTKPTTITTAAVSVNALSTVRISGSDVTVVNSKISGGGANVDATDITQKIEFASADKSAILTLPKKLVLGGIEASTAGDKKHIIAVVGDQGNVSGKLGSAVDKRLELRLLGDDGKATIQTVAANFFASLTSDKHDKAEVTLDSANLIVYGIGAEKNAYNKLTFNNNATIDGNTFSQLITVAANKTATFNGNVTGTSLTLGDAGNPASAILKDGVNAKIHFKTSKADLGKLDFQGGGVVGAIGESAMRLEEVKFNSTVNSAKEVSLTKDIYSKDIQFAKSIIFVANANVTLGGDTISGQDNTFNLGSNNLKLDSAATLTGALSINTTLDRSNSLGAIHITKQLDLAGVTGATINLTIKDNADLPTDRDSFELVVGDTNAGKITLPTNKALPNIIGTSGQRFVKWTSIADVNSIRLVRENIGTEVVKAETEKYHMNSTETAGLIDLSNKNNVGDAKALFSDLGRISEDKYEEAVKRALNPIQNVSTVTSELAGAITAVVSTRIATVSGGTPSAIKQVAGDIAGVAAGDEAASFGAWGSPFYSQATQKMRKGISGFKSKSFGGTFGFDTLANDTLTVGAAVTVAKTDVKHRNIKVGDKTKVDTMMFSLYAMQNITENWFAQGIASFGSSKVKNSEKHLTSAGNQTASGKYDSMSYGFEALGGYNYKVSDLAVVTPIFGLGYTKFNDSGYKQTGTTSRNFTINKKSSDKFEGILGARASFATDMNGVALLPEVHAFVRQNLSSKTPKVNMTLNGMAQPLPTKNEKPAKTFFNLGTSVMAKSGMMEYGAGYDAHFANKYVGHQGTLKVRVNF